MTRYLSVRLSVYQYCVEMAEKIELIFGFLSFILRSVKNQESPK